MPPPHTHTPSLIRTRTRITPYGGQRIAARRSAPNDFAPIFFIRRQLVASKDEKYRPPLPTQRAHDDCGVHLRRHPAKHTLYDPTGTGQSEAVPQCFFDFHLFLQNIAKYIFRNCLQKYLAAGGWPGVLNSCSGTDTATGCTDSEEGPRAITNKCRGPILFYL